MRTLLRRFWQDESGMSFVFVAGSFMSFIAASALAIDVGMFMTARGQAQNSADAGALAGATALVFNSFTNRSTSGPAVQSAINAAQANLMMGQSPSVLPSDVTFLNDPSGQPTRIRVVVNRTAGRSNAIPTLLGGLIGVPWVSIGATAIAEASPANAMTCVKPFMIPDKWQENSSPANGQFDLGVDVYIPANQSGYTGYTVARDVGSELQLRANTGEQTQPSFYYSWKMPDDTGGNYYRENIATCNTALITWGQAIIQEPGNMSGPTIQGIQDLIDKDPGATWNPDCNCVRGSAYTGQSPRVFPIPLYDPQYYAEGQASGRPASFKVANFLGFFVDRVQGHGIYGWVTNIVGVVAPNAASAPANAFPLAIRLVE